MLLNEITTSDEAKIAKINKALKETYGFTLVSEVNTGKLNQLYSKIADDLYNLKLNQATAQDSAYMQKLLVLEGLKMLRGRKAQQIAEASAIAGPGGRALDRVLGRLSQYVHKACEIGDEYEEAIKDAMKAYAIQPYRFDNELVEYELRKLTVDCDPLAECGVGGMMYETNEALGDLPMSEVPDRVKAAMKSKEKWEPCQFCKDWEHGFDPRPETYGDLCPKCLGDGATPPTVWMRGEELDEDGLSFFVEPQGRGATVMNSKGEVHDYYDDAKEARKVAGELNSKYGKVEEDELNEINRERYAERDWVQGIKKDKGIGNDDPELSIAEPNDDDDNDYFAHMAKRTSKKRNEMKEGYVKQLRRLLESETDQAESLIAAKSFSQELQDMIEKLGRLVNEDLPAVSDQMRDSHGADIATGFEDSVNTTLGGIMDNLRSSKQELDNSVSTIADGGMPSAGNDMDGFSDEELGGEMDDMDAEMDLDGDVDLDLDGDVELGDEFGGEEIGDVEEPLGRAKKESMKILAKKIVEAEQKLARLKSKK